MLFFWVQFREKTNLILFSPPACVLITGVKLSAHAAIMTSFLFIVLQGGLGGPDAMINQLFT